MANAYNLSHSDVLKLVCTLGCLSSMLLLLVLTLYKLVPLSREHLVNTLHVQAALLQHWG